MKIKTKIKIDSLNILLYLILIPFLYPQGFSVYFRAYKMFFTAWLYAAIFIAFLVFIYNLSYGRARYKNCIGCMFAYYVLFIFLTYIDQGGINEGFQKLFVAPALCVLCTMCLRRNGIVFLNCLANIMIVDFLLNMTVFNSVFWTGFFSASNLHIIFLGHVQVASQLGILGVFVAYLLGKRKKDIFKAKVLFILSIITMIMSQTIVSLISIAVIILGYIYIRIGNYKSRIFNGNSKHFISFLIFINVCTWTLMRWMDGNYQRFGFDLSLNGRGFIWEQVWLALKSHLLLGYGAYGVKIKTFWSVWSDAQGMNYAHNELLQRLLDGGIILLIFFLIMLYSYVKYMSVIREKKIKCFTNLCLLVYVLVMLIESVTEYYYFYIFLSILAYLPELINSYNNDKEEQ